MMKSLLPQSQLRRSAAATRSSGGGAASGAGDGAASDGGAGGRAPASSTFWFLLHAFCCLISLFLGFRFSRFLFFLLFSTSALYSSTSSSSSAAVLRAITTTTTMTTTTTTTTNTFTLSFSAAANPPPSFPANHTALHAATTGTSGHTQSHVAVGRHGIRIRPWPHPDPVEVMQAHRIMKRVQEEQRRWYGVKEPRQILVVTPTYSRAFQALHLTGLLHSLRNVPYRLTWMVVEAGGVTNATASLLARSGLTFVHIPFPDRMPHDWADRHATENRMRLHALRVIRERKMDGVVVFADDSNVHSMELFDEVHKVQWMGAVSVGILAHTGTADQPRLSEEDKQNMPLPVQGPACNSSGQLAGWHTFNSLSFAGKTATVVGEAAPVLPRGLEWAGFVLNSRMLWKEAEGKPDWAKDLDAVGENGEEIENPLTLLNDPSFVEPLGNCGKKVLLWWLRVEARADSKFPQGWVIEPPLEVVVPAKRTPWPENTTELSSELLDTKQDPEDTRLSRTNRLSRSRSTTKSTTKRKGDLHDQEN